MVNIDDTAGQTYGYVKQGAGQRYTGIEALNALLGSRRRPRRRVNGHDYGSQAREDARGSNSVWTAAHEAWLRPSVRPPRRAAGRRRSVSHRLQRIRPPRPAPCGNHEDGRTQRVPPSSRRVVSPARGWFVCLAADKPEGGHPSANRGTTRRNLNDRSPRTPTYR